MARPSLKAERTEQIFGAFLRCVARYGVDGASLERVAEEAKLQRSMIRHFVGNRDELVNGLAVRLAKKFTQETEAMIRMLPSKAPAETLIDWLFDPNYATHADTVLALEALIAAAPRFPDVRKQLLTWYEGITGQFTDVVKNSYPDSPNEDQRDIAIGLIGIYFNTDAMEPLGLSDDYRSSGKRAAQRLLRTLGQSTQEY